MITPFHAKYYAHELVQKKSYNSDERISSSLFDAAVALNPHQIDAALFAFKSPLSKGVILADEVGLGKTIEAGLVMCQLWAERKRQQLVICPSSLRKQWSLELQEKFNLPSVILEKRTYDEFKKQGELNPFEQQSIVILSYHYASRMCMEIASVNWDIVIIDEAHKLRNSYRSSNKMGQGIKLATAGRKKLLLTATPLQNNLVELYGLSTMIDEHLFGDLKSYRDNYMNGGDLDELRSRLSHFCKRTLRKDVLEYVKYTERLPIVKDFTASDAEQNLYDVVSEFIQREDTYAIPYRQKQLTTLIIRKLLASSTWALLQTLETISGRLLSLRDGLVNANSNLDNLFDEDEVALMDELLEETEDDDFGPISEHELDMGQLNREINQLRGFMEMARAIDTDTKSTTLLEALSTGFAEMHIKGANKKALIFTESRRTQDYLKLFLEANGYAEKLVLFNGSNTGKESTQIYQDWIEKNKYSGRISGSPTADKRNSLIEHFRDYAEIMIATESAAEGVNLQFCSLVINYDLPWNPQRIEQRIGRCHRYGQKNDVVVINFLNRRNYADVRVHELLDQKFSLFNGVFGSSDEVLGSLESGVDFEKRILEIYQQCRTPEEIETEFNQLQKELEDKISQSMQKARDMLFHNFDSDVHERLKLTITEHLDRYTRLFWALTAHQLGTKASFDHEERRFSLLHEVSSSPPGDYCLIRKGSEESNGILYRMSHPLGQYVINTALHERAIAGTVTFDISNHKGYRLSQVEQLRGQRGYLTLHKLTVSTFDSEEVLLFAGALRDGTPLSAEQCRKLFECGGQAGLNKAIPSQAQEHLNAEVQLYARASLERVNQQNLVYIREEEARLSKWTQDMILAVEKELESVKLQIREAERKLRLAATMAEHGELNERLNELNRRKRTMRSRLEANEEEVEAKRRALIADIQKRSQAQSELNELFTIEWEVI
ncbi:MAG: DEAD/DEAH box helicase family protein [Peptococcaceae bacterium]|nr:DEAD/DEAH box helicase family protein [Peptococcaceae bacterium]